MSARFGLEAGGRPHTLKEIAALVGVSRERVRQVEGAARKRLRRQSTFIYLGHSLKFLLEQADGVLSLQDAG